MLVDIALFGRTYDQEQWKHAFGLALTPARTNQDARESYNLYKWEYGKPPPNNTYGVIIVDPIVLFTGLQLAGPNLTPQTFPDGMFRAPIAGRHAAQPDRRRAVTTACGPAPTGAAATTPGSSGGTRTRPARTRSARSARASTSTRRWASATRSTRCRRTDPGLFDPKSSITIFKTIPPQYAPPDYPSPAK